ncbi:MULTISPECIES: DUF3526 domain-containing protein [unclassified Pseudoalteromonas]|uniref:DUF3526 domain-containing protein n=1 Tax=unclassified Pseudoalteromonas TaxID=194690 RepID=UPI0025B3B5E0|nr:MULTISPECIES: DUF3526 domain-containing protein [unclassified Pseudoalteromonas]MDN3379659.1 DUF3526 domain-containing protein [Pseudoalteromonas sp. APC 3893]MDN3387999.1 DUF3526 domain-containing protein [Pseudoalteromonas sp. APC 4017]
MKRLILATELKNLWREKLVLTLFLTTSVLALVAFLNAHYFANKQRDVVLAAQQMQQQTIQNAKAGLPERLASTENHKWWEDPYDLRGQAFYLMQNYAIKTPLATAPIATGQADVLPYYFKMLIKEKQHIVHQYDYVHPLSLLLGQFDLSFVVIYLLPLLIISICFNALASERQGGQLRLLMLQGGSATHLLTYQLLLRSALIVMPFLLISSLLLVIIRDQIGVTELLSYNFIVLCYSGFWIAITAWVNSRAKSAANNAATLVTCWLGLVIVVPALVNTSIALLDPTPSRIHYIDSLRAASDDAQKASEKTLAQYFQDHPELAKNGSGASDYATKKIATINSVERAMEVQDARFLNTQQAQQQSAQKLQYLSPALIVQTLLVDLAGNGLTRHHAFMCEVEAHHQALQRFFANEIAKANQRGDFAPCDGCSAKPTLTNLEDIPQFSSEFSTPVYSYTPLAWLLLLAVGLLLIAKRRVNKLDSASNKEVLVV